jgi:hypothetical protein
MNDIAARLHGNFSLISKLNFVVARTLGSSLEESIDIKLDYDAAKSSLEYYSTDDIAKIKEEHIPKEVSEIKLKSTLKEVAATDLSTLIDKGRLFSAI